MNFWLDEMVVGPNLWNDAGGLLELRLEKMKLDEKLVEMLVCNSLVLIAVFSKIQTHSK